MSLIYIIYISKYLKLLIYFSQNSNSKEAYITKNKLNNLTIVKNG